MPPSRRSTAARLTDAKRKSIPMDDILALDGLESMAGQFDELYPSHGSCPVLPGLIPKLITAAEKILAGKADGTPEAVFGQPIIAYDMGVATFLCDRNGWESKS